MDQVEYGKGHLVHHVCLAQFLTNHRALISKKKKTVQIAKCLAHNLVQILL